MSPLRAALERDGFAIVRGVDTPIAFERLLGDLGQVVHRTVVEIRAGVATYVCRPEAVPLHTDHPDVDLVAWWCERQDLRDGAALLVDARAALLALEPLQIEGLPRARLPCPELRQPSGGAGSGSRPVLDADRAVYFAPWLRPTDERAFPSWSALLRAVERAPRAEVRLAQGEVLIVDNHRMLHGRRELASGSRRRLARAWVVG